MRNQTENRRRRKRKRAPHYLLAGVALIVLLLAAGLAVAKEQRKKTEEANLPLTSGITEAPTAGETRIKMPPRTAGTLFLVNANFGLDPAYQPGKIVQASKESARRGISLPLIDNSIRLSEFLFPHAAELYAYAAENGNGECFVSSGYRDFDEQQEIYDGQTPEELAKGLAAKPGHSEHQSGLGVDISFTSQHVMDNAWRCGFILRYPENKSEITGIMYEPWHFRYVGKPYAELIAGEGLCLEELPGFLRDKGSYSFESEEGGRYLLGYADPDEDGMLTIPEEFLGCEVSPCGSGAVLLIAQD